MGEIMTDLEKYFRNATRGTYGKTRALIKSELEANIRMRGKELEHHGLNETQGITRALEELAAIVVGNYPRMHVYPTGVSDRDVNELRQRRTQLALAVVSVLLAACLLVLQIYQFLRHKPQHRD